MRSHLWVAVLGISLGVGCGEKTEAVDSSTSTGDEKDETDGSPTDDGQSDDARDAGQNAGPSTDDSTDGAGDDDTTDGDEQRTDDEGDGTDGTGGENDTTESTDAADGSDTEDDPTQTPQGDDEGPVATWDPEQCQAPAVPAPEDPDALNNWSLAREYCSLLEAEGCLEFAFWGWRGLDDCSEQERLDVCVGSVLEVRNGQVLEGCATAWSAAIECAVGQSFDESCNGATYDFPYGAAGPCDDENAALLSCVQDNPVWKSVEGSYATCYYGPGITSQCAVTCDDGEHYADLSCGGPEGVPLRCDCAINGKPLNEGAIVAGTPDPIYVSDCEDAARQAADGMCTSRVDCCFEYSDGKNDTCMCGAIPERAGYESCEALADSVMGRVVDLCPQYEPEISTCFPPPCGG